MAGWCHMRASPPEEKATGLPAFVPGVHRAHALSGSEVIDALNSSPHGLGHGEAAARLERFGRNALPRAEPTGILRVFLRQFLNPLIYILVIAAVISLLLGEWSDAVFIFAVLLINAIIGTVQEYSAERSATALQQLVTTYARTLREGDAHEIDAETVVPGDIVLLESGDKVPADVRLLDEHGLVVDESLLTGESLPVNKMPERTLAEDTVLGDRANMVFAGTHVLRGRGRGIVVATGLSTELGRIAEAVLAKPATKAPLLVRMERFVYAIAVVVGIAVVIMAAVALTRGSPLSEIFILAVALAVSAIPEGLPVALTVALAIGMNRMSRRNVIVRKLVAVEALGSCTFIASDKTGTLTLNELTARRIASPGLPPWEVTGEGMVPEGRILAPHGVSAEAGQAMMERLCRAVVLSNEGFLGERNGEWVHHGDAVDVALLVLGHKSGITQPEATNIHPEVDAIPFEPERRFSASLNRRDENLHVSVKGAWERVSSMCDRMLTSEGEVPLDAQAVESQVEELANEGYRILAVADGPMELAEGEVFGEEHLRDLCLLGLVGMIDPLRKEAKAAVAACRHAGIDVSMVTGDHPGTAFAIARELDLAHVPGQVVTGRQLAEASGAAPEALDALCRGARVFARVEPQQKLEIVQSLSRLGHFVAVTGDGANDAPALRESHVGVAMGGRGTDVARETSDLIVTDDNFASIVAGVEEGRIAYGNVRKVIFLLISTGAAEIVLFTLGLLTEYPIPLVAVQLLWLNLVTNGIQDVALAFEPAEGDELRRPPRSPREPIFNRTMIERVVLSALVVGSFSFAVYFWLLNTGYTVEEARNGTLLLMVLFENVHVFNSRSETLSAFRHNPLRNRLLLFGTAAAQLVHIGAMYTPGLSDVLGIAPVSPEHWGQLLVVALSVLVAMELHKAYRRYRPYRARTG